MILLVDMWITNYIWILKLYWTYDLILQIIYPKYTVFIFWICFRVASYVCELPLVEINWPERDYLEPMNIVILITMFSPPVTLPNHLWLKGTIWWLEKVLCNMCKLILSRSIHHRAIAPDIHLIAMLTYAGVFATCLAMKWPTYQL